VKRSAWESRQVADNTPKRTLQEIEAAVDERLAQLCTPMLQDVAMERSDAVCSFCPCPVECFPFDEGLALLHG
jgi:hypothetical protein